MSGCVSTPQIKPERPSFSPASQPLLLTTFRLSGSTIVNGQEVAYLTSEELANLEDFQAEAIANTQALEERVRAWNDLVSYTDHLYQVYEYTESARQSEAWSCRAISAGLFSLGILVGL